MSSPQHGKFCQTKCDSGPVDWISARRLIFLTWVWITASLVTNRTAVISLEVPDMFALLRVFLIGGCHHPHLDEQTEVRQGTSRSAETWMSTRWLWTHANYLTADRKIKTHYRVTVKVTLWPLSQTLSSVEFSAGRNCFVYFWFPNFPTSTFQLDFTKMWNVANLQLNRMA